MVTVSARGEPSPTTQKIYQAVDTAKTKLSNAKKKLDKAKSTYSTAKKNVTKYNDAYKKSKSSSDYKKLNQAKKKESSAKKAQTRAQKSYDTANKSYKKLTSDKAKANLEDIKNAINTKDTFENEGKMAIYPSDGSSDASSIVYFAPTNTESITTSSNVTSWAVDKGAPRGSYIRISSRSISLDGLITGDTRAEAEAKYDRLNSWSENHNELTFVGDISSGNLFVSDLGKQYTGYRDNLQVSMTLTYIKFAEITEDKPKRKTSKSSKTTAGNRKKSYTTLTIKPGDTLWAYSQKYGKSVSWLAKVNNIKNPNLIYAGQKIRVK